MLRFDGAAKAGKVGIAHVIDEDDDDIRSIGSVNLGQRRGNTEEGDEY